MDKSFTKRLYEDHHKARRAPGFSVLREERGKMFSTTIGKDKKVLDLGCRDGALTQFFTNENEVLGVDVDTNALAKTRELGIDTAEMDLYGDWSEIRGRTFDAIVAGEILEHLFHPEKIVEKVREHLTEDGIFVGSVPNAFSLKNRIRLLFGQKKHTPLSDPTHVNHFSRQELKMLLERHFGNVEIIPLGKGAGLDKLWPGMFAFDFVFIAKKWIRKY